MAGVARRVSRSSSPASSAETCMPSVRSWARPLTATQGRRCSGTRGDGGLADQGGGVALAVDDDEGAGAGLVGAAQGLGERGVGLDRDGAAGQGAGAELGQVLAQAGHAQAVAAPVQMMAARIAASRASVTGRCRRVVGSSEAAGVR